MITFTNLTRENEIGANSYLFEIGDTKFVMDAGMHPKKDGKDALPHYELTGEHQLRAIIVTHAHQDHVGTLPVLQRRHPHTPVFMTEATQKISEIMLHNSVNVMGSKKEELGIPDYPFYTHREIDDATAHWVDVSVGRKWYLPTQENETDITAEFFNAGHILGSVGVLIEAEGQKIFYTGDVNFRDQTLSTGAEFPESGIDTLILETTRGDSPEEPGFLRADEEDRFAKAIDQALAKGKCVLIPVFALGKTQEVMAMIYRFRQEGKIGQQQLYIGGLSTKITEVHDALKNDWPRNYPGLSLYEATAAMTLNGRNIDDAPVNKPYIYAISSGMMTEKTLSNAFARRVLPEPDCSVFFVGYADPESPGGKLRATPPGGMVQLEEGKPDVQLLADVQEFNFSAHAPREHLLEYAVKLAPKQIVLVHGDPSSMEWFQKELSAALPNCKIIIPPPGQPISL